MQLVTEPDIYSPSIDDNGNYIDKIPSFNNINNGIKCLCGSRKDKVYDTYNNFSVHIKTKHHQNWLVNINFNKANYYVENTKLKNTIHNQMLIIANMEKQLNNKSIIIDCLTEQLQKININNNVVINLIDL